MAEKNTLSILQNIKKKMQKFDQEPKKIETISGANDEFEYISTSKPKAAEAKIPHIDSASAVPQEIFNIDKDLELLSRPTENMAEVKVEPAKAAVSVSSPAELDDLGLDDFSDLDGLDAKSEEVVATPIKEEILNIISQEAPKAIQSKIEEIDDSDHDLPSFDLENEEKEDEEIKATPTDVIEKESSDDFNMDFDADLDLDEDSEHEEIVTPDSAKPMELKNDLSKNSEIESVNDKPEYKNYERKIDDINFNKSSEEKNLSVAVEEVVQNKPEPVAPSRLSDVDDEQFLKDLGIENTAQVKPQDPALNSTQKKVHDLDDLDLNALDEIENSMDIDSLSPVTFKEEVPVAEKKEEIKNIPAPLEKTEEVPDMISENELELMLRDQNFAEIAMNILEPKLDAWLDEHLHGLVEAIVQEEVKKLFEKR